MIPYIQKPAIGCPSRHAPRQEDKRSSGESEAFSAYLANIRRYWFAIALFVTLCVVVTALVTRRMVPLFEASANIELDHLAPSGVIGPDSTRPFPTNDNDEFMATQVRIIQSDDIVRPVAERYHLLAREQQLKGMEADQVARMLNGPVELKRLKVSRTPNTNLIQIHYISPDPALAAEVVNAIANRYLELAYRSRSQMAASRSQFMERQLTDLKSNMERSNTALAKFEQELHITNSDGKTNVLEARLLQLNTELTNAQSDRLRKEAALDSMKSGSLEAAQISGQGKDQLEKLSDKLLTNQEIFASVKAVYGPTHPEYVKAETALTELERQLEVMRSNIARRVETDYDQALNRERMLQQTVDFARMESDRLAAHAQEYQQLKREAEADRTLYAELVLKIREEGINSGVQNTNVRIVELARPPAKPFTPNFKLNLAIALLLSTATAMALAILSGALDDKLWEPERASYLLGASVIGALPAVRYLSERSRAPWKTRLLGPVESRESSNLSLMLYKEAIRKLRNSILLAGDGSETRSLLVTSALAGEGKSVTALDLAASSARCGKRTLLIDADLRRLSMGDGHSDGQMTWGLAQVLSGEVSWQRVVGNAPNEPGLDILACGHSQVCAADLICNGFRGLLADLSRTYDFIVVDSPPMLAFAESLDLAAAVQGVIVVAQAGRTSYKSVATALGALHWVDANVVGVVLSRVIANGKESPYAGYYSRRRPNRFNQNGEAYRSVTTLGVNGK